ncbi:MAG: LamG-like jellyroll fold domain-containing protein [Planctomycetota bacterium]
MTSITVYPSFTRRYFRIGLAAAVLLAGCAGVASAVTFQRIHWAGGDQRGMSIERTSDGGYITAGDWLVNNDRKIVLRKLDAFGQVQWTWVYESPGNDTAQSVRQTADGGYIIGGETSGSGAAFGILLLKTAPNGALQWARAYLGTAFTGVGGTVVRERSAGGYVVIGRRAGGGTQMSGVLLRLDPAGAVLCGEAFVDQRYGAGTYMSFNDVRENADGTFTIVGFTARQTQPPFESLALRVGPCGAPLWVRSFNLVPDSWTGEGLAAAANGDFIFTGAALNAAGLTDAWLVRTNAAGAPLWQELFPGWLDPRSVRETTAGDLVVTGQQTDGGILKTNAAGGFLFARTYGGANTDAVEEAIPTPDGGYAILGRSDSFTPPFGFYVIKTDPAGRSGCNEQSVQLGPVPHQVIREIPLTYIPNPEWTQAPVTGAQYQFEHTELCFDADCVRPPQNMTLWLPFDGGAPGNNIVAGNNGTLVNGPALGGGYVGTSLCFDGVDDYVNVPSYGAINAGFGHFSIDAWVKRSPNDNGVRVIVDKRRETGGFVRGYSFYLFNGLLCGQLANGIGTQFTNYNSLVAVPLDGQWHHVAMTVQRNSVTGGRFYIDGAPVGAPFDTSVRNGLLSTNAPFRVGSRSSSVSAIFLGCIDEVEFFRRVLTPAEVAGLYTAKADGKCRQVCHLPWDSPFCKNVNAITVTGYICNYTSTPQTYSYWFQGTPVGPGCTIAGPTSFTPASGTVTVPAGQCAPITVIIGRPSGMTAAGLVGCYEMLVQNTATGLSFSCHGSVQDRRDWCVKFPWDVIAIPIDFPAQLGPISVTNTGDVSATLRFRIVAIDADMMPDMQAISLNGLPPGVPYEDSITLPPNGEGFVNLTARFVEYNPANPYTILIEGDPGDGGYPEVLTSMMLENEILPAQAGDLNCDGRVNFDDINPFVLALSDRRGYEAAYPDCNWYNADCNGDDGVSFEDINAFVELLTG